MKLKIVGNGSLTCSPKKDKKTGMKKKERFLIIVCSLVGIACYWCFFYGWYINAASANVSFLREEGKTIFSRISGQSEPLWPFDGFSGLQFSNSTDYLNVLICSNHLDYKRDLRYSYFHSAKLRKMTHLSSDDNMWTVVKNLPAEAPDNVIVLATRNIDPLTLRACLTGGEMDNRVSLLPEESERSLKLAGIVFRKDGSSYTIGRRPESALFATCRHIYVNQPFDLTSNRVSVFPVTYLTPKGEVTPVSEGQGERKKCEQGGGAERR